MGIQTAGHWPPGVWCTKLKPGKLVVARREIELGPVSLGYHRLGVPFAADGEAARGSLFFGIVDAPGTATRWDGITAGPDDIATTGSRIDVCTLEPQGFYTVVLRGRYAAQFARALGVSSVHEAPALRRNARQVGQLRASLRRLLSQRSPRRVRSADGVLDELLPLLSATAGTGSEPVEPSPSRSRRIEAVRACRQYLRDFMPEAVTLDDLSRRCGLRPRSLINAFEAVTGMSPMAYLRTQRLHKVRQQLLSGRQAGLRIIDVAADWGLWHMSHFATAYRAMFGETPSETAARFRNAAPSGLAS